jgi:hypothetical protein
MMHFHQASLNLSPCMGVAGPQDGLRMEFDDIYRSLFRNPMRYMEVVELLGSRRRGYTRVVKGNNVRSGEYWTARQQMGCPIRGET